MRGLKNLGNTCYFNTAVQCLAHVPALAQHLFMNEYTGLCAITFEYQKVLKQLFLKGVTEPVDPTNLFTAFQKVFPEFKTNEQNDAQEVIINLIAVFERSLGSDFIKPIFEGDEIIRGKKQPFTTMILPVTEPSNLQDLLADHDVTKWPAVISFTFCMTNYKFPVTIPFTFMNRKLFAVVMHKGGSVEAGHYGLLVKVHDKWYIKEDENVHELPCQIAVMRGDFYMAMYRKSLSD